MAVIHHFSNNVADFTGTFTGFNSQGSTTTIPATNVVRPVDWNSGHDLLYSLAGNTLVQSTASGTNVYFAASGNISIAGSTGTIVISGGQYISSYENILLGSNITRVFNGASVSDAVAFYVPQPVSASFMRIPVLMTTNSTTMATTAASLSASAAIYSTFNAVVYSLGTGANSQSLQSVASGSAGFTFMNSVSVAANGTQYSVTQAYSAQANGGGTTLTTQYSISNTNYSFTTNQIATNFSTARWLDIPFANSLKEGQYWMIVGMSTSSTANSTGMSAATNANVRYSNHYGASQANIAFGIMGSTNLTSGGFMGAGSFSTAGGGTTASLPISAISSQASNVRPYFQLLRSA